MTTYTIAGSGTLTGTAKAQFVRPVSPHGQGRLAAPVYAKSAAASSLRGHSVLTAAAAAVSVSAPADPIRSAMPALGTPCSLQQLRVWLQTLDVVGSGAEAGISIGATASTIGVI